MSDGVRITKMSGAGNDFIVLRNTELARLTMPVAAWVRQVCRRGVSLGADGVLIVEPLDSQRVRVEFFNPDASRAFCGNGSRCAARFAAREGWVSDSIVLLTSAGEVPARIVGEQVRLELPPPVDRGPLRMDVDGEPIEGRFIVSPVPHFVAPVDSVGEAPLERLGPAIRRDASFGADGANVDLVQRRTDGALLIRTWERGVEGETLACGSGAVAAAFAARLGGEPGVVRVVPASGIQLEVEFTGRRDQPSSTVLVGDARFVIEGELDPESVEANA